MGIIIICVYDFIPVRKFFKKGNFLEKK